VVVAVSIKSVGDMLESKSFQIAKKVHVTTVIEVVGADFGFKRAWNQYFERASMGHPGNPLGIARLRENVMNLLYKRHVGNGVRSFIVVILRRREPRKVSIRVVNRSRWRLERLYDSGSHFESRLCFLSYSSSTCLSRIVVCLLHHDE